MICSTLLTLTQPSGLSQLKCHFLLKLLLTSTTGLGVSSVLPKHPMLHTHYTHEICLFISLSLQRILAIRDCVLYTDISLVPHMCLTPRYLFKIDTTRGTRERLPAKQLLQPQDFSSKNSQLVRCLLPESNIKSLPKVSHQ